MIRQFAKGWIEGVDPAVQQYATLIVTVGAVCFAVAAALWAWRLTQGARAGHRRWKTRTSMLEARLDRAEGVFNAHPGVILTWSEEDVDAEADWGEPRLFGSPSAMTALLNFAGATAGPSPAASILDGIADYEAREASGDHVTLRKRLRQLRETGRAFSMTISGPEGRFLDADGRPAGAQAVLWLTDSTVRSLDESDAAGKREESLRTLGDDPLVFLETLDKSPLPAWRMSAAGKLLWANAAYLAAVEEPSLDSAVKNDVMLHPDLADLARAAVEAGEPVEETRRAVIAGDRCVLGLCLYPVSGGVSGVAVDVSGEMNAKEALSRHVRAHDETLDHMAEAVAIFGKSRRMVFHNRAFSEMFSLDEAWLDDGPTHGEILDRLREARRLPEQADFAEWKAGELKYYEDFPEEAPEEIWPLPDGRTLRVVRQQHPLGGVILLFDNVTQEVVLSAQYKTALTVRKATLDNLMEGVAVFGSAGELRLHNAAFDRMWNIKDGQLDDSAAFEDVAEICRPLFHKNAVWEEIKGRVTDPSPESRVGSVGEMERADGSTLTWMSQPLPDGATVLAFADITAIKREEKILRQHNEALQEADRQKTDFVRHVSYQLKTPLTTISGYAEMLKSNISGELNERQQEFLGAIETASQQLDKLIKDILDIAAIDAGALELDLGDVHLEETLQSALETAEGRALEGHVKLALDARGDLGAIRADETRVKQILFNLINNAIRHTPEGGEVTLGCEREDGAARIWVEDTGAGLEPEKQAKVFDRFNSGRGGGAGLGLALVREFAAMHGGWVEFESEQGKGACVTVWLPENARAQAAPPELALSENAAE